jgi:hypothetical protein
MKAEHCSKPGFNYVFKTPNYGFMTTSAQEWRIVVEGAECPPENLGHGRVIKRLDELMKLGEKLAELCKEEVIATTDYTGPMVSPYH